MNDLRSEQLSLCIGTMIGQIAQLLNGITNSGMKKEQIYHDLNDIHQSAALQIHELFYKGNKPEKAIEPAILDKNITELEMTVRTTNCLRCNNIETVRQLTNWSAKQLYETPNLGRKGIREIEETLTKHGLKLKGTT